MYKTFFKSPLGNLVIIVDKGNLVYCNWDDEDCLTKLKRTEREISEKSSSEEDKVVATLVLCQLKEYFSGKRERFQLPLNPYGSPFKKEVWYKLCETGYGAKISYKELGEKCGRANAVRAVANACGANPLAVVVPCHRVIRSDGTMGGYTGGLWRKEKLLGLESGTPIK